MLIEAYSSRGAKLPFGHAASPQPPAYLFSGFLVLRNGQHVAHGPARTGRPEVIAVHVQKDVRRLQGSTFVAVGEGLAACQAMQVHRSFVPQGREVVVVLNDACDVLDTVAIPDGENETAGRVEQPAVHVDDLLRREVADQYLAKASRTARFLAMLRFSARSYVFLLAGTPMGRVGRAFTLRAILAPLAADFFL